MNGAITSRLGSCFRNRHAYEKKQVFTFQHYIPAHPVRVRVDMWVQEVTSVSELTQDFEIGQLEWIALGKRAVADFDFASRTGF